MKIKFKVFKSGVRLKLDWPLILVTFFSLFSCLFIGVVVFLTLQKTEKIQLTRENSITSIVTEAEKSASMGSFYRWWCSQCETGADCSGFIVAIYKNLGQKEDIYDHDSEHRAEMIYQWCSKKGFLRDKPEAGDIIFFGNPPNEKNIYHCGLIEHVFNDGSFLMIHSAIKGKPVLHLICKPTGNPIGKIFGCSFIPSP